MLRSSIAGLVLSFGVLACVASGKQGPQSSPGKDASSGFQRGKSEASRTTTRPAYPSTPVREVMDIYHEVEVVDPYRWLEDWKNVEVQEWSRAQNEFARGYLDKLPSLSRVRDRLGALLSKESASYSSLSYRPGRLFAIKRQPPKKQPFLVVLQSPDELSSEKLVLDPNELDASGATTIDWYEPSPDGELVAVSLSKAGTESGDLHVVQVSSGARVYEMIPRVNGGTAGGDVAWAQDASGFFYTRYPRGAERAPEDLNFYQQLFFHQLGTPTEKDRPELTDELPKIAEIQVEVDSVSGRVLATVQKGDGGQFAHFIRSAKGTWTQFTSFENRILQATFGPANDLYLISRRDAPHGEILRLVIDKEEELSLRDAELIVQESMDTIVSDFWGPPTLLVGSTRFYVLYQLGGPSEIRVFDLKGNRIDGPRQSGVSAVGGLTALAGEQILFSSTSFVAPQAWVRFDPRTNETAMTALESKAPVDLSSAVVLREFATSKDGSKIPVNIIMPKGAKLDGSSPCIATGYGGFGVSLEPSFNPINALLLEHGVIIAVANLRGGGEYGEDWHRRGALTFKQNVFDDFAAVLQHLIDRQYTSPARLGVIGGSNGGLLMGAMLSQHPELVRAVVSLVGIYDMLRVELSPNGAFNVTEFGTVENRDHFRAMFAYSPYHHIVDGTTLPATLLLSGENDPRVDPMQSRKMVARLQASNAGEAPILLRTSSNVGHGGATPLDERIEELAHIYTFLFEQLGIAFGS